jgi:hypothetical protein
MRWQNEDHLARSSLFIRMYISSAGVPLPKYEERKELSDVVAAEPASIAPVLFARHPSLTLRGVGKPKARDAAQASISTIRFLIIICMDRTRPTHPRPGCPACDAHTTSHFCVVRP